DASCLLTGRQGRGGPIIRTNFMIDGLGSLYRAIFHPSASINLQDRISCGPHAAAVTEKERKTRERLIRVCMKRTSQPTSGRSGPEYRALLSFRSFFIESVNIKIDNRP